MQGGFWGLVAGPGLRFPFVFAVFQGPNMPNSLHIIHYLTPGAGAKNLERLAVGPGAGLGAPASRLAWRACRRSSRVPPKTGRGSLFLYAIVGTARLKAFFLQ